MLGAAAIIVATAAAAAHGDTLALPQHVAVAVEYAAFGCPHVKRGDEVNAALVAAQLALAEWASGVPRYARGTVVAAACCESGFRTSARGDLREGRHKAVGVLQLWPWAQARGVDRENVTQSAEVWLWNLRRVKRKTDIRCGYRNLDSADSLKAWVSAWVAAVRSPVRGKAASRRCREKPLHLGEFNRLRARY